MFRCRHISNSLLILCGLLAASMHSHAQDSCGWQMPCYTLSEIGRQSYRYDGYLVDLDVSASKSLPVSLARVYELLGIEVGTSVPVSATVTAVQLGDSVGRVLSSYDYSVSFGGVVVSGGRRSALGGIVAYPFFDVPPDNTLGFGDSLGLWSRSYQVAFGNPALAMVSAGVDIPSTIDIGGRDGFQWIQRDPTGTAIDTSLPASSEAWQGWFPDGEFFMVGGVGIEDGDAVLSLEGGVALGLRGIFSATPLAFAPVQSSIEIDECVSYGFCVPLSQVPVPGAGMLFISGLLALGTALRAGARGRGAMRLSGSDSSI